MRRHLGETIEPQTGDPDFRFSIFDFRFTLKRGRGQIEQTVGVLQFVLIEPVEISPEQERQIVQLVTQVSRKIDFARQREDLFRRMLVSLQFAEQQTQLLREARQQRRGPKDFQLLLFLRQQRAQHHDAAFFAEQFWRRLREFGQDKSGQPLERKNLQSRVAGQLALVRRASACLRERLAPP